MKIKVSTDSRIEGTATAIANVTEVIEAGLSRFSGRLTRVEVHLSDINGPRGGVDRRCLIEARPASRDPIVVDHQAESDRDAVRGAVDKMHRLLATTFAKADDHRGGASASGNHT